MAIPDLFIGVDAGSSVLKAVAFDLAGRAVAQAAERTPLSRLGAGRVEADPEAAWSALARVLRQVVAGAEGRGRIAGLGVSGAMVGAWVIDREGRTLRPGINWEDCRAQSLIDDMRRENPRLLSDIFAVSGSVMQQGCTLPVTAALLRDEPEVMGRAAAVMGYKDWLRFRLTGRVATDASEAAVAPGDARRQARSADLMRLFGLDGRSGLFPEVLASAAVAGAVTAEAARATGLPEGLPVATGAGDVIANVIGAGGLRAGALTGLLGTTCMIGLCTDEPVFDPPDLGLLFSLPERHWFRAMVNVAGTLNLDWAAGLLFPHFAGRGDILERVGALAAAQPVGADGVVYLPYLSESGIIAPVADPQARGQFAGLTPAHGREAMVRAVYEGVAFSIADLCDLLSPPGGTRLVLTGGGARSAFWCRMIAEVTGREVIVPEGSEFGARGAALLAATSLGRFGSVTEASESVAGGGTLFRPTGEHAAAWEAARARFQGVRDRALGL
jgi:sugar (pentulose or hexulose) kinase